MSRRGENIYKRKDGRWEGRYKKTNITQGKTKYGYVYGKTYGEVKQKLLDRRTQERTVVESRSSAASTFESMAKEWLSMVKPSLKISTWNKYNNLLRLYILPNIGALDIHEITHNIILEYSNKLLMSGGSCMSGLSEKTVSDTISVIRSVLRYSAQKGCTVNFDSQSVRIKQHPKELCILSLTEQENLTRYLLRNKSEYNIGILVCLFTGLRIGEICALRWADISLTNHTIHVQQTMQRVQNPTNEHRKTRIILTTPKSSCSIRTIPIPQILLDVIKEKYTDGSGYFLTNSEQRFIEPRTMQNQFKSVLKQCNIRTVNYHVLRHTFATRCIEIGFDVKSLSEILGHASVTITMNRYVHPSMKLKQQNMQLLSNLFAVK